MNPPKNTKFWIGSKDGIHYVATDDAGELPGGCVPAPISGKLTPEHRRLLEAFGCEVREIYLGRADGRDDEI
jgi:hypothetical protein